MLESAAAAGMTEQEFWDSTPRYFMIRCRTALQQRRRKLEDLRFTAFYTLLAGGVKLREYTDVCRFEWEPAPEFDPVPQEELDAFGGEADEILRITNPKAWEAYMAAKQTQTQLQ